MQVPEMRTFYNLHYHKRILRLIKTNFFSNPNVSFSKSTQISHFSPEYRSLGRRSIHSSNRLSSNDSSLGDENPRVWTGFDPVSNDVITTTAVGESESVRCESDSGDEKVGTLSGLGSFVEGAVPERGDSDGKEFGKEGSEQSRKSWASVYPKRSGSEGLRSELDSGDDKFETFALGEDQVQERGSDADDKSGMTPKSWSSVYLKEIGGTSSGTEAITGSVGESESLRYESDSGNEKFETPLGIGSTVEGSVPDRGGTLGKKKSDEELSGGRSSLKSWPSVKRRGGGASVKCKEVMASAVGGSERGSDADEKSEEDISEMIPKSWASAYLKEIGGTSSGTEAITGTVDESESLRYASDSGNDKFGTLSEGSVPDRGGSVGKKKSDEELTGGRGGDRAGPESWSSVKRQGGGVSVKSKSGDDFSTGMFVSKKKKGKTKTSWVCSSCGETFGQWWGSCRFCGGEIKQFSEAENVDGKPNGYNVTDKVVGSWFLQKPGELLPQRLTDVNKGINQLTWRIPLSGLFGAEVGRVLGGGLVPGCLVLVGGDPGVGKSTLLLQIAAMIAEGHESGQPAPVVYVSGEESVEQIANRADRMRIGTDELFLYSGTDIEDILEKVHVLLPRALIVDSIQTVYLKGVAGSAGGIVQVKECTQALLRFAKKTNIPVLLIGHVTKTGDLAGPRVLEHIVDVVLYMEGEKYSAHRFLRSVKNRFGSTDELGVFEMSQGGLQAVLNPSDIFLSEQHSDSEILVGLAVAVIIDGSRSFLLEIQALCLADASVPRQFNGVQQNRAQMIISVLIKQAGLMLQNNAIFVNVVSGVKLQETAGDLAIAAAICSSCLEFPIPNDIAFIGEIGLGGELRPVPRMEKRMNAVAKLGYRKCIVPKSAEKQLTTFDSNGMIIQGCKNLKEVINIVFRT